MINIDLLRNVNLSFLLSKKKFNKGFEMYRFVQESDLRAVFTQLRQVSQNNHKVAFERCLNSRASTQ